MNGFVRGLALIVLGLTVPACADDPAPAPQALPSETGSSSTSMPPVSTDWLVRHRVHAHTRLSWRWQDRPAFRSAADTLGRVGARVIVRHVKSGAEDPMWPSRFPLDSDGGSLLAATTDQITPMVRRAHDRGLALVAYYWFMADETVEELHPEWRCMDARGRPAKSPRGVHLDITGGYRELVLARLLELSELGVDGFYFDSVHMPRVGCWGSALEARYERETGRPAPRRARGDDPDYWRFLAFQADAIAETFAYWRDRVRLQYPGVNFIISTGGLTALSSAVYGTGLPAIADAPKTELTVAMSPGQNRRVFEQTRNLGSPPRDIRMAFGWALLRDLADGAPPHVWAVGFETRRDLMAAAGAVMTWGGIFNLDIAEDMLDPQGRDASLETVYSGLFELGDTVGEALAGTRPLRWAAVHYPEAARDARLTDPAAMWREVLWPVTGGFAAFVRAGLPVGLVGDAQLARGELDGYAVLYLPAAAKLSPAQREVVDAFAAAGGTVVENEPAWRWPVSGSVEGARSPAPAPMASRLGGLAASAPVRVVSGGAQVHGVVYENSGKGRLVVVLSGSFGTVDVARNGRATDDGGVGPVVSGVRLEIRAPEAPLEVRESVSGATLDVVSEDGVHTVAVPGYRNISVVVIESR